MAAYLLHKRGRTMSHLKLMKLLYLAGREAIDRYGAPISGDLLVAMLHGPALSNMLNHMDGDVESSPGGGPILDRLDFRRGGLRTDVTEPRISARPALCRAVKLFLPVRWATLLIPIRERNCLTRHLTSGKTQDQCHPSPNCATAS